MKRIALAMGALLMLESAALACSCLGTDDPVELRRIATESAEGAIALVEAEALTSFAATGKGERMRVVRTLAGSAPAEFTIARRKNPSSASCDVLYEVGERALIVLYPPTGPVKAPHEFRTSGLCAVHMLDRPIFRDALIDAIGVRPRLGDRG